MAMFFAVGAAVCNAFYFLSTRRLASHDRPETTMLYTSLVGTIAVAPFLLLEWKTPSTLLVWAVLIGLGVFGALGHWLLILAHRNAPSSVTRAVFLYTDHRCGPVRRDHFQ